MLVLWRLDANPIKPTFCFCYPPPIRPGLGLVSKYLFVHQHHGDSAGCLCTDYKSLLDVGGL